MFLELKCIYLVGGRDLYGCVIGALQVFLSFRHHLSKSILKEKASYVPMWGKKGGMTEEQLFFLADVLFLVVIALTLFFYLASLQKDTTFEKTYVAHDLAALLMTIQTFAGNGAVEYVLPFPMTIELTDKDILVSDDILGSVSYPYGRIIPVTPHKVQKQSLVTVIKKEGRLTIA